MALLPFFRSVVAAFVIYPFLLRILPSVGLPVQVQQWLDIVRVAGNNQVHPGTLDVRDDATMAETLFELVNIIVEDRIARPKQIAALYAEAARNFAEAN